jgi:DNA-binding transcriptional LysR family regulator
VAAPAYLKAYGRPTHPMHLARHKCLGYTYSTTPGVWHYTGKNGEEASVRPTGQLGVNNGEALVPALLAGLGIACLPDFIIGNALQEGTLEAILQGWDLPQNAAHFITPPGGPRPARVELLADFLVKRLSQPPMRKLR